MEFIHQKNTDFRRAVPLVDKNTPANFLSDTLSYDEARHLDSGGSWTSFAPATAPAEIGGSGVYDIQLSAAECNHDQIFLVLSADGGATFLVLINLVDTWPPRAVTVNVDAVIAVKDPVNKIGDNVPLEMHQGAYKQFRLSKKDADGNFAKWSGKTLRFVVFDTQSPPNAKFAVEDTDITLESNDEVVVVPVTPAQSVDAADNLQWVLWDVTTANQETDEIHGSLKIVEGVKSVTP